MCTTKVCAVWRVYLFKAFCLWKIYIIYGPVLSQAKRFHPLSSLSCPVLRGNEGSLGRLHQRQQKQTAAVGEQVRSNKPAGCHGGLSQRGLDHLQQQELPLLFQPHSGLCVLSEHQLNEN